MYVNGIMRNITRLQEGHFYSQELKIGYQALPPFIPNSMICTDQANRRVVFEERQLAIPNPFCMFQYLRQDFSGFSLDEIIRNFAGQMSGAGIYLDYDRALAGHFR